MATEKDAAAVQAIYAPFVEHTAISFEFEAPSVEEVRRRIASTMEQFPWLVCDRDGDAVGYAYAGAHRARAAYRWAVDVSVYVAESSHRSGVGRALYTSVFEILVLQGFYRAYAGVTLPNDASVGLHESLGFQPVGIYQAVGFKFGRWHDVGWWQRELQTGGTPTRVPLDLDAVRGSKDYERALARGTQLLRRGRSAESPS